MVFGIRKKSSQTKRLEKSKKEHSVRMNRKRMIEMRKCEEKYKGKRSSEEYGDCIGKAWKAGGKSRIRKSRRRTRRKSRRTRKRKTRKRTKRKTRRKSRKRSRRSRRKSRKTRKRKRTVRK